jgi:Ca2+-binding EF-hand superfamily protein
MTAPTPPTSPTTPEPKSCCSLVAMDMSALASNKEKMKQAFNLFDRDGDGKISQDELKEVLKTLGRKDTTNAEIRELIGGSIEGMFTARGGSIDFETFISIVVSPWISATQDPRVAPRTLPCPRRVADANFSPARFCLQQGQVKGDSSGEVTDLAEAFKLLDKRSHGYITENELIKVCEKLGENLTESEANAMVSEALLGYEGKIYYDGLLKILITQ